MATKKGDKSSQSASDLRWSSRVYGNVGNGSTVASNEKRDSEDVPWSLITVVLAVILTFFIVMPILAFMYYDMYYATQAAVIEVRKMRELRKEIQIERMYSK